MRFTPAQWDTYQTFERRWKKLGYENLSAAEQTFYALEALDSEVNAGCLGQYFASQAGNLAPVVVDALSTLGVPGTRDALRSAMRKAWPDTYPCSSDERRTTLVAARKKYEALFEEETRIIQDQSRAILSSALHEMGSYYSDTMEDDSIDRKELLLGLIGAPIRSRRTAWFASGIGCFVLLVLAFFLFVVFMQSG